MSLLAVRADDLVKRFGATKALAGLSFRVPEGSITALLGRNGAGKTTAIRCLVGLLRPDSGIASLFDEDGRSLSPGLRARVGYVSERLQLDRRLTVDQLGCFCRDLYPTWDDALFTDLLARLDLDRRATVGALSQGQGRKAALALNLAFRPRLLLLDEPAANLDAVVRREFLEVLLHCFRTEGVTVLLSTHLLNDVERVADRVVLIEEGRRRLERGLDELKESVKELRLAPRHEGAPFDPHELPPLPGELRRRRLGGELLVTVEDFAPERIAALEEHAGARVEPLDLDLEEIFLAYGTARRDGAARAPAGTTWEDRR